MNMSQRRTVLVMLAVPSALIVAMAVQSARDRDRQLPPGTSTIGRGTP